MATPIDVAVFIKRRKTFLTGNRRNRASFTEQKKKQNFGSLSNCGYCTVTAKICLGQPPTLAHIFFRFHPNLFTFGRVIAERLKAVLLLRRVFLCFASNTLEANTNKVALFMDHRVAILPMLRCFHGDAYGSAVITYSTWHAWFCGVGCSRRTAT